jgi:hypothetical protein
VEASCAYRVANGPFGISVHNLSITCKWVSEKTSSRPYTFAISLLPSCGVREVSVSRAERGWLRVRYLAMADVEGRLAWRKSEQAESQPQRGGSGGMW